MSLNRERKVLISLLTLALVLFLILYKMQNDLYWKTPEYERNSNRMHRLHNENMQLKDYYLEQASYTNIERKAKDMGYVKGVIITP
jgi:hypothetical protein